MPNFQQDFNTYVVRSQDEGLRMDKLLSQRYSHFSRTYFQNLLENGLVLLNGKPIKKRVSAEEGDEIEICFQASPEISLEPQDIPLDILYEDEHLLAVNKPTGMVVHPAPGNWSHTFANALLFHCKGKAPGSDPIRPGIVHRLDKETTGVLIAAKTQIAHQKLIELFAQRKMEKLYLAICVGRPKNGKVDAPIARHPVHRKEMTVLPNGREAVTEIQTAACNESLSLVLAKPKTGRTHQIRVHLKHLGAPVLGDSIYGFEKVNRALKPERLLLHAYRLSFLHPITKSPIQLTAPIPEDMKHWLQKLSRETLSSLQLSNASL